MYVDSKTLTLLIIFSLMPSFSKAAQICEFETLYNTAGLDISTGRVTRTVSGAVIEFNQSGFVATAPCSETSQCVRRKEDEFITMDFSYTGFMVAVIEYPKINIVSVGLARLYNCEGSI